MSTNEIDPGFAAVQGLAAENKQLDQRLAESNAQLGRTLDENERLSEFRSAIERAHTHVMPKPGCGICEAVAAYHDQSK